MHDFILLKFLGTKSLTNSQKSLKQRSFSLINNTIVSFSLRQQDFSSFLSNEVNEWHPVNIH